MSGSIRICRFWRSRSHRFFFCSSDDTELIRRFPAGGDYSRIFADATCSVDTDTPEVVKSPTDFTDIHRSFVGGFGHADFTDDADFSSSGDTELTQIFCSSDDTELIRRFPAVAITHGFSRMRPVRSIQIPPEIGQSDSPEIP